MRAVFTEECDRAGVPERLNIIGEDFAGPTIAHFGTDGQKQRYLRPILTGEEIWCQLFSEPDSGSDLASLRTKAVKADGGWRISGQKIWTSRAQLAAHAILLARTGGGERQRGITYFLLPMDSDGVTVRPLAHMLGEAEFNEVFLDDVFLPDDAVVGAVDGGWKVAMATLAFERVAIATGRVNTTKAIEEIIADIRGLTAADGSPLGADPLIRQQVADLWGRALVHRADQPAGHLRGRLRRAAGAGHLDRQALLLPAGRGPGRLPALARAARRRVRPGRRARRGPAVAAARQPVPGHRHRRRVHLHPAQHRRRAHPRPAPWLTDAGQSSGTSMAVLSSTSEIASVYVCR